MFDRFERRALAADRQAGGADLTSAEDAQADVAIVFPNIDARSDALFVQQLREAFGQIVHDGAIFAFTAARAPSFEIVAAPRRGERDRAAVAEIEFEYSFAGGAEFVLHRRRTGCHQRERALLAV